MYYRVTGFFIIIWFEESPFTALFTALAFLYWVSADPCADELISFG
jgi:hypothetical protein